MWGHKNNIFLIYICLLILHRQKIVGNCSVFEVDEDNLTITEDNIRLYS